MHFAVDVRPCPALNTPSCTMPMHASKFQPLNPESQRHKALPVAQRPLKNRRNMAETPSDPNGSATPSQEDASAERLSVSDLRWVAGVSRRSLG